MMTEDIENMMLEHVLRWEFGSLNAIGTSPLLSEITGNHRHQRH